MESRSRRIMSFLARNFYISGWIMREPELKGRVPIMAASGRAAVMSEILRVVCSVSSSFLFLKSLSNEEMLTS